jgi:hypothetical protein
MLNIREIETGHLLEIDVSYSGLREHKRTEIIRVEGTLGGIDFDHVGSQSMGLSPAYGELVLKGDTWELVEWMSSLKDQPTVLDVRYHRV